MSPYKTYIVRVLEYDFELDEGVYVPNPRQEKYLFGKFVVEACSEDEAIDVVTERTGWLIKAVEFL